MNQANYELVHEESTPELLVIRDVGPWDQYMTVTNAAETVVYTLWALGHLPAGRRLYYYDSLGSLDELLHQEGVFKGFRPVMVHHEAVA
jgi:hypothetical protein